MEIEVTVTKEQIIDALVNAWYVKEGDVLSAIKQVDGSIGEWDFTIKCWLYFDGIIQEELRSGKVYADELQEQINRIKAET